MCSDSPVLSGLLIELCMCCGRRALNVWEVKWEGEFRDDDETADGKEGTRLTNKRAIKLDNYNLFNIMFKAMITVISKNDMKL